MTTPRVKDNDHEEITVTLGDKLLRSYSYENEAERRIKIGKAREFVEGWFQCREACAGEADKIAVAARAILERAKQKQKRAGMLAAAGYQGDPDFEVCEATVAAETAEDIATAIRSPALSQASE